MSTARLYLAAYDVRCPKRLPKALREVKAFACGGQYSAYECWLERGDIIELENRMDAVLDTREDSFALIPLVRRKPVATLGTGVQPADPDIFYVE